HVLAAADRNIVGERLEPPMRKGEGARDAALEAVPQGELAAQRLALDRGDAEILERRRGGETPAERRRIGAADPRAVAGDVEAVAAAPVGIALRHPLPEHLVAAQRAAGELGELRLGAQPVAERDGIAGDLGVAEADRLDALAPDDLDELDAVADIDPEAAE